MNMNVIEWSAVVDAVAAMCVDAAHRLPDDVVAAIQRAVRAESHPGARRILELLLKNARIADDERIPLCQDTGVTVVFVDQGHRAVVTPPDDRPDATLSDAINAGVARGYAEGYLRKSMVADPAGGRVNTGDNTPAIIHHRFVPGDAITLTVMLKGGGCENKSRFTMLTPADGIDGVERFVVETVVRAGADACPPFVVGVGIGGNFETACLLSKRALCCTVTSHHPEPTYVALETKLLDRINASGVGPQGTGGDTTALAVLVETAPCHIASLPVAVNIECHSHRHTSTTIQ